jgi:hypothetical protein
MINLPDQAVSSGPFVVELLGVKFHTFRSTSRKFRPWNSIAAAVRQEKAHAKTRALLKENGFEGEIVDVFKAKENEDPDVIDEQGLTLLEARQASVPDVVFESMDDIIAANTAAGNAGPHDAKSVARLVRGWDGVTEGEDQTPVPFSRDALMSMLSGKKHGDCDLYGTTNGNAGSPLPMAPAGEFDGMTYPEAFCQGLPEAVRTATITEAVEIAEKKVLSSGSPSGGDGTTTAPKGRKTKSTKPGTRKTARKQTN